ncbi:TetR-like C-terminal domain-containing protein [Streptomyces sp. NPDC056708]|uniref:TetR-like C-terminal domain-containing protein n=2 Tax=Streptomyces TaxID=1883 RepID=UPI0036BF3A61
MSLDEGKAMVRVGLTTERLTRAGADQTHVVRMLGSVFHGYVSLEMTGGFSTPPSARGNPGPGSWIPSTLCFRTGPHPDQQGAAPPEAVRRAVHRRT